MARIELSIEIAAPRERYFDLARSVELHLRSTAATGERAVAGKTAGLLALGDEVTWRARHFGVRQSLAGRITAYDRPRHFQDTMLRGAEAEPRRRVTARTVPHVIVNLLGIPVWAPAA